MDSPWIAASPTKPAAMPRSRLPLNSLAWLLTFPLTIALAAAAESDSSSTPTAQRPYGIENRVPWTSSRIVGSPEPPTAYRSQRVFEQLTLENPVELLAVPGTNRLLALEVKGRILSFVNQPQVAQADLALDLAQHVQGFYRLYGFAFHPRFEENRYCYVAYVLQPKTAEGSRVSRFRITASDPPTIDPASEEILLTWISGGHNGACLQFGPDGCLYISTGDGGDSFPPDGRNTGQDLSDLLASILRIDVDAAEEGKKYRVPRDNPFVGLAGARPEIWAYGLRNPWKMSFDPQDGSLWVGDVGWELWEMVYRIERGGNYGWSVVEGRQPVHGERKRGPTPILPPTVEHSHTEARSITGGYVYGSSRLPQLKGAYVYGDYVTGKVWGLRHEGPRVTWLEELVDTPLQIVCFGLDHDGEVLLVDYEGAIHRLIENPAAQANHDFPTRLSETGLFASTAEHVPAPGVVPYSIVAEPWSDGAVAERFVALPGESQLGVYEKENVQIGHVKGAWQYPDGAVLAKTLSLPADSQAPGRGPRRIETQILHMDGDTWRGYSYLWNEEQTDAELAPAEGTTLALTVSDTQAAGGSRRQSWTVASRTQCILCHTTRAGSIHGFNATQLNQDHAYNSPSGRRVDNQLRTLEHIGLFKQPPQPSKQPLVDPYDHSASLAERARTYLHVNCAHCHRRGGGGSAFIDLRYELPLEKTNLLGARPIQGTFGIHGAQLMFPGQPSHSVLFYRLAKLGRGRMPFFGSSVVDQQGVKLLRDWIEQVDMPSTAEQPTDAVLQLQAREEALLAQLAAQAAGNKSLPAESLDGLLSSTSGALALVQAIDGWPVAVRQQVVAKAVAHADPQIRDLFERFVREEQRVQRLGNVIRPEDILALSGDAARGRQLFLSTAGVQCKNCHRAVGTGTEIGPELSAIGKKYNRAQLLETILEPSKAIDPKYVTYLVETSAGKVHSGLLVERTDTQVVLKDAKNEPVRIPAAEVELLAPQATSLMPELLLRDMTAQEVADLLEFLSTLRGE